MLLFKGGGFLAATVEGGRKEGNGGEELSCREGERGGIFFATTTAV